MKLNKLQRYTVYCIMLEESENPSLLTHPIRHDEIRATNESGMCWMWKMIFGDTGLYYFAEIITPELYKKYDLDHLGFSCWHKRIAALKKCIEETHPDNN